MSFVRKLTKSRDTLLDMLELRGFNVEPFKHFSTEEVNIMYKNSTKASKEMNPIDFVATGDKNKVHVIYDTPAPDTIQKMMQKPEVQEVMKNAGNKAETMVVATCTD